MHIRGSPMYIAVVGLSQTSAVLAAVAPYGQCGGMNFQGDTACADGWTCNKSNDWYSQCVPGSNNGGTPAAPTTAVVAPSAAPVPTEATSVIVVPSGAPILSNSATEPVALPSTLASIIATPSPVAEPEAASSAVKPASSTAAAAPTNIAGNGKNGAKCSLDAAFKSHGKKYFGVATDQGALSKGQNSAIIQANFGQVTPENSMKWDATEATQGKFTLTGADALVKFATDNSKLVRGHTTVWHSQLPTWVSSITDKTKLQEVMVAHIKKMIGTYAGKIYAWDVVNEILNEDGSFRSSVFYNVLGEDFVATAFNTAREADPEAKLYINDYNLDSASYAKTKSMVSKVSGWVKAGVPIDGIGSQSHLANNWPIVDYPAALESLCAVVSECAVTELDIKGGAAADYKTAVGACLDVENCVGVTVWGVSDTDSWIGASSTPLLFDGSFQAKANYNAVCELLA